MTTSITPNAIDFIKQLGATDKERVDATTAIRLELGYALLDVEHSLPADKWQQLHDHLAAVDLNVSLIHNQALGLLQTMTTFALFANTMQQQRDNALWELKDALDRADEAEHTAEANLYNRLLDNIQETFYCNREHADKLLCALWDVHAKVDDRTADLLDSIANVIDNNAEGL